MCYFYFSSKLRWLFVVRSFFSLFWLLNNGCWKHYCFFFQFWHLAFWWQSLFHRIFIILFLVPFGAMRTDLPTATGAFMELWSIYLVEFSGLGSDQVSNNPHVHTAHSHQAAGEGAFAWVQLYVPAPYHLCWWACCEYTCVFSLVIDGLMLLCCRW